MMSKKDRNMAVGVVITSGYVLLRTYLAGFKHGRIFERAINGGPVEYKYKYAFDAKVKEEPTQ